MAAALAPRLTLRFGVTGHRPPRLAAADHEAIVHTCEQIFRTASATLAAIYQRHREAFAAELPATTLVSSLAEGADVIVAEAALRCGLDQSACLPFAADRYRRDFQPEAWARTQALIEVSDRVLELGERVGKDADAYEAAGRLVMAQADILIAVWDGAPAQGRGGTAQIVAEAIAMGLPVIHVDPAAAGDPRLVWRPIEDAGNEDLSALPLNPSDGFTAQLEATIAALTEPPIGEDGDHLRSYLRTHPALAGRAIAWPLLLAITGAKKWRRTRFRFAGADEVRADLREQTGHFDRLAPFGGMLSGMMADRYAHADAEANRFAMRYRATFITNFGLAGFAVFLALSSLLLPNLKLLLIVLELVVIGIIIAKTQAGRALGLHRCWLDRRDVAERLRMLMMAAPLGRLGLREGGEGQRPPNWVHWYVRASAREMGLPQARFDEAYINNARSSIVDLLDEQGRYHQSNAHAMAHADHNLHHAGDVLFFGTVLACALFITAYVATDGKTVIAGVGGAELVTFFTALCPALAGALYGIRMQGDFSANSRRSRAIAAQLSRLRARMRREELTYLALVENARHARAILLAEVEQWRSHYESRPLTLPG